MADARMWRSLLFIPANSWKMLNKAAGDMEDGVMIDLEDACPVAERETGRIFARDMTPVFKTKGIDVFVRINSLPSGATAEDLKVVVTEGLDGVMLPKSESREDILKLCEFLEKEEKDKGIKKKAGIIPLLESPKGVLNAYQIGTASDRIWALAFGALDFMRELGAGFSAAKLTPDEYFPILLQPRSIIGMTASALKIPAIDTPFFGLLTDMEGLEREISKVKLLGFKGKLATHPRQIEAVNRIFSPSEEDVAFSRRMVESYKEAVAQGKGAGVLDGKMIDYATYAMGLDVIALADGIAKKAMLRSEKL
jgi:citrate lyase subunit beta/citryl-CoA lyase